MARGKRSLVETVNPEDIVYSGEVVGEPNILLPDTKKNYTYGIFVDPLNYKLAVLKDCYRTDKDESGNEQVVHYKKWSDIAYLNSFESTYYKYIEQLTTSKDAKLKRCNSIQEVISIREEIKILVSETFPQIISQSIEKGCELIQENEELKQQIQETEAMVQEAKYAHEELMNLIKEKRKIVIQETEPKKHRLKLEK